MNNCMQIRSSSGSLGALIGWALRLMQGSKGRPLRLLLSLISVVVKYSKATRKISAAWHQSEAAKRWTQEDCSVGPRKKKEALLCGSPFQLPLSYTGVGLNLRISTFHLNKQLNGVDGRPKWPYHNLFFVRVMQGSAPLQLSETFWSCRLCGHSSKLWVPWQ